MSTSSISSKLTLSLGEQQLAKLTNESAEIRMRALEQIETRFIRCLQHDEAINFKPVLLLKQLIRWFGHTPLAAPDRVLALMLELLRSDYCETVVNKIPCQRLEAELNKIRKILKNVESKRAMELLDNIQSLVPYLYKEFNISPINSNPNGNSNNSSGESRESVGDMELFALDNFNIGPEDFETAWSCASPDDVATMKTLNDTLTIGNDVQLQENLTSIQIKLCDYPAEQLFQDPYIFLQLLHVQQLQADVTLLHANRALLTFIKLLQHRLRVRKESNDTGFSAMTHATLPQQLRVSSVLSLLLNGCLELLGPPLLEHCAHNWHLIELSFETIRTYDQLGAAIPESIVQRLGLIVPKLIRYCISFDVSHASEIPSLVKKLMIPRLESVIFNGLLLDVLALSLKTSEGIAKTTARSLLQPLILDISYLSCLPERMKALCDICGIVAPETAAEEQNMVRIKQALGMGLAQLVDEKKLTAIELLQNQSQICLVLLILGSDSLMTALIKAIVKCTSFYIAKPELRKEAESLLYTLFDLSNEELRNSALRQLKQPVVDHFHAFMNGTNYMAGCNNLELARNHILGLPMSSQLLRRLFVLGWRPEPSVQVQQWVVDYMIMMVGLAKLVPSKDFIKIFKIVMPVIPLIVCRAIDQPQLQHMLWELFDPDNEFLEPPQSLRGNVCYLYHPDAKYRKDAIGRIGYVLVWQDHQHKYRPAMDKLCLELIGHDICLIKPPVNYYSIFSERSQLPFQRSMGTLLRLLETQDLKPSIRKSTLIQLNVLMHSWEAVHYFTTCDSAFVLCLRALHDPLVRETAGGNDEVETLLPAVSIILRVIFRSERFRQEFKHNAEMIVCLLRCLFLMPHEMQLRADVSICIFTLLFHEHVRPRENCLKLDVDLSAMVVPVTYEVDHIAPLTDATEGLELQKSLYEKHFESNAAIESQHWRLYVANRVCGSPKSLSLSVVGAMDIRDALKLKPADVALVQATLVHVQLEKQLIAAKNCSSHETLQQLVASVQLFLVLLRDEVEPAQCTALWKLMHRYVRLTPGNNADLLLYISLLELCLNCLRHRLPEVVNGLKNALETDPHHSFREILRDDTVSLNLLSLVTECLVQLLRYQNIQLTVTWPSQLFDELSTRARSLFEQRKLQHVRCVLAVLRELSEQPLQLDSSKIEAYYQHYVQLSSNLRTSTQTGAQWQRDCLFIVCRMHVMGKKLGSPCSKVQGENKVLRYLLGLCGHSDTEVRSLAWVAMANWIQNAGSNMTKVLLDFHDFLPGGMAACCLSTMLDDHEALLVRELAGRVFEMLIRNIGAAACNELFNYHSYLKHAHAAIMWMQLPPEKQQESGLNSSFDLISCYVSICARLIQLEPGWSAVLCNHAFFNALGDVLKMPTPAQPLLSAYMELCAGHICKLYAMCYQRNFDCLQRGICRDPVLLKSFISLINTVLDPQMVNEKHIEEILKLLMVFCKDANAYGFLCEKFREHPELLFDLLLYGLNAIYLDTDIQKYTLSAISLLLIKAQDAPEELNLLLVFEAYVEDTRTDGDDKRKEKPNDSDDKENSANDLNKQLKTMSLKHTSKKKSLGGKGGKSAAKAKEATNAAVLLYHGLDQLFEHLFPSKTYSFLVAPKPLHVQVCEVLGNLLKQSVWAVDAARQFKLLERVLHLLEAFLDDSNIGNATVYVRRVGAHKSRDIINNLLVLLNLLMHWQNSPHTIITEPVTAARIVRMIVRLWPWLSHSAVLKHMTVRLTTLLTEHSFEMCKQTSQVLSGQSHSLLQLMVRVADHESTKKEGPSASAKPELAKCGSDSIIEASLRVMINCCSCAEGRLSLGKMRVLDMFDTIMPATGSNPIKVKPEALVNWIAFWEVFSRYELGYKVCHLQGLLHLVRRSPPLSILRLRCLRIVRNMCFSNHNRMLLVNMTGFTDFLRDIVSQPVQDGGGGGDTSIDSYVEHHLVVLCLWKLFGFSAKCRAMLRGTKLFKQLTILSDHLASLQADRPEQFEAVPFAVELKDLLGKLFDSLQA
ncbi:PREDICTED: uncharacterized protein LOC108616877 [Drosophila arizonae]|uniref:Uncharacterized protein LOC108616877 n=1 Tax=Drosophila arizonae TaxID=7263 RepID=A0ABM1PKZ1_DROAR|nr:PREDICTED: uncharacterized protein LOC108616877 [Drosophila arizonae]